MIIIRKCPFTKKVNEMDIDITQEQYDSWAYGGKLIQRAMPNISADEREFIMTGITPDVWDDTFKEANNNER